MNLEELKVSEYFYSIQGEGMSAGAPAVFLRLSMCNFACSWCDTIEVWKRGVNLTFDSLDAVFENANFYSKIRRGAHLVITGGNPLLQEQALVNWLNRLQELNRRPGRMYIEVETQGDRIPSDSFASWVRQWNVSPKLTNSGIAPQDALKKDVLDWFGTRHACFKFPVNGLADLQEVTSVVDRFRLRRHRVYLMPICSTQEEFKLKFPEVARMVKDTGFKLGLRLQVQFWDKTTGI